MKRGAVLGFTLALAACQRPPEPAVHIRTEYVMGTLLSIRVEARDSATADAAVDTAFAVMHRLDGLLSNYDSSSEIWRVAAGAPEPVTVAQEAFAFIERTLKFSEACGGALNPAIGPVVGLWGFFGDHLRVPPADSLHAALARTDYRLIRLDSAACTVTLEAGMQFDTGATGKGYALERAAAAARSLGPSTVYFDFGGQIYREAEDTAVVAVRHPRQDSVAASTLSVATGSVATSGDYERFFEQGGRRYAHIIDPRTGYPVAARAAVSVFARGPFLADALSTALFVLGPDSGSALLERYPGTAALFAEWSGDSLAFMTVGPWPGFEAP